MKTEKKIKYKDLSTGLRVAIVTSYVMLILYSLVFLVSFINALL